MIDIRKFATEGDKSLLGIEGTLNANAVLQKRFRIEGVLGVGDRAVVYQARDISYPDASRYFAVKEIRLKTDDPKLREIILRNAMREANILAGLSHPSIPTIHDFFSTEERAYIVMEFINGATLETIIRRSETFLPVQQVVEWCIALCDVLSYLHTCDPPIIFRKLEPSQVMVDVLGRLRLIGFGVVKNFVPGQKGAIVVTDGYSSPESYQGLNTPLSDVFSVGALLHYMLMRHDPRLEPPFTFTKYRRMLHSLLRGFFTERSIRKINPEVPSELEAIMMRALAFAPEERFVSAEDMKLDLQKLLLS